MLKQPSGEYRGFRSRGIRLNEDMLPELGRLSAGRTRPMLGTVHAFDKAHAVMLCEEDNDPLGADAARQLIDTPYK